MPTPSITQQVIKYCEMGFFPICKLQNGEYIIFSPFKNGSGAIRTSYIGSSLEECKKSLCSVLYYTPNSHHTLTEIIGFYQPGFKPFEVGDKVTVRNTEDKSETPGIISDYYPEIEQYKVSYKNVNLYYFHYELEPYLEPAKEAQCPKESKPLEVTLEDIAQKFGVDKISIVS